jgi:hypothetical protein
LLFLFLAGPAAGAQTVVPEELFRLGGDSEAEEEIFGMVMSILVDENGRSYVLDQQLGWIQVFDADGRWAATLGQEGEGPGEFRNPRDFFWLPDGRIGVIQMMPPRIAVLDREGRAHDDLSLPGDAAFAMVDKCVASGDGVVVKLNQGSVRDGRMLNRTRLLAMDTEGRQTVLYAEKERDLGPAGAGMRISIGDEDLARLWDVGPDGRVWVCDDPAGWKLTVHRPGGGVEQVVERPFERVRVDPAQRATMQARADRAAERGMEISVPEYEPDLRWLGVRDDGEVWVLTSRGREGETLGAFEVLSPDGTVVDTVAVDVPFRDGRDAFVVQADRLYVIREAYEAMKSWAATFGGNIEIDVATAAEDEEEEPRPLEIVAYRLPYALQD